MRRVALVLFVVCGVLLSSVTAQAQSREPNIGRIAKEGVLFTDAQSHQSCTAGRAAFITVQHPIRMGLIAIGMPDRKQGLFAEDPTIAELLKPYGYVTAQVGKDHLGDRNE